MLKFRQTQVQKKVIYLWSVTSVFAIYTAMPALMRLMAECVGSGSGASCGG
ncbi:MAG: hypothetical protein R6X34_00625 [Chloroflexota bacterium]